MDNLGFGLGVAAAGIGIVFGLLVILWLLLAVALRIERRSVGVHAPDGVAAAAGSPGTFGGPDALDPRLVAAITIAILRHADARRRQAAPAMRSYWPGSLLFASRWVGAGRMRQSQPWRRRGR